MNKRIVVCIVGVLYCVLVGHNAIQAVGTQPLDIPIQQSLPMPISQGAISGGGGLNALQEFMRERRDHKRYCNKIVGDIIATALREIQMREAACAPEAKRFQEDGLEDAEIAHIFSQADQMGGAAAFRSRSVPTPVHDSPLSPFSGRASRAQTSYSEGARSCTPISDIDSIVMNFPGSAYGLLKEMISKRDQAYALIQETLNIDIMYRYGIRSSRDESKLRESDSEAYADYQYELRMISDGKLKEFLIDRKELDATVPLLEKHLLRDRINNYEGLRKACDRLHPYINIKNSEDFEESEDKPSLKEIHDMVAGCVKALRTHELYETGLEICRKDQRTDARRPAHQISESFENLPVRIVNAAHNGLAQHNTAVEPESDAAQIQTGTQPIPIPS